MRKFYYAFIITLLLVVTTPAWSLDDFIYRDVANDGDGKIVTSDYIADYYDNDEQDYEDNFGVRITIYDDDDEIYQEIHYGNMVEFDQFGTCYVYVGMGDPEGDWTSDAFDEIVVEADTRIKFEITFNDGADWILSSVKAMSSIGDILMYMLGQEVELKRDDGSDNTNGDSKSSIERAKRVNKDGGSVDRENTGVVRNISKTALVESRTAEFDASKGNVFVYTGNEAALTVANATPGQIIYVSKSEGEGTLNFGGVAIGTGETYQFLYNGKNWSSIK